jgi:hypothetical protein
MKKKINSRSKGIRGENEFCKWIADVLGLDEVPTRNLEQTRESGADILGVGPFVFEVKRCQNLELSKWWKQVNANTPDGKIAVVAFRKNRNPWRILISAGWLYEGHLNGYIMLNSLHTVEWLRLKYKEFGE